MSLFVDIKKKYKGFSLDIKFQNNGQRLGMLGVSGCGKSMTLKCIAGIEKPTSGKIILNNRVLFDSDQKINLPPQERRIGYLFQNYALFPNMTVRENIGIGVCKNKEKKKIVDQMILMMHLEELQNRYPNQLSGGQQQRVALARSLAYEPEALLLDEPFSALDSFLKDQLQQELLDVLKGYNSDTLFVSHSRDELFMICQNMMVMDHGHCIISGITQDIFHNPTSVVAARLTGCKNIARVHKVSDYEVEAVDWNMKLKTNKIVEDDIRYIGIRAHDIRLGSDKTENENCYPVDFIGFSEGPYEQNLIFNNSNMTGNNDIWWKVTRAYWENTLNKQAPSYIMLAKEHIMLLK